MTQETLERANKLVGLIKSADHHIKELRKIDTSRPDNVSIGNRTFFACRELIMQIVEISIEDNLAKIEMWNKELNEL